MGELEKALYRARRAIRSRVRVEAQILRRVKDPAQRAQLREQFRKHQELEMESRRLKRQAEQGE